MFLDVSQITLQGGLAFFYIDCSIEDKSFIIAVVGESIFEHRSTITSERKDVIHYVCRSANSTIIEYD